MTLRHAAPRLMSLLIVGLAATFQVARAAAELPAKPISDAELRSLRAQFERPASVPQPQNNPITAQKVTLGQMLFFDPRLSGSGLISCATCHNPGLGWSDGLPKGLGHLGTHLGRHTPTILNVAYGEPYFWDGRAASLEEQAKGPLTSAKEMNMSVEAAIPRLKSIPGYVEAFSRAYPNQAISLDTVAAAIATFERTVISKQAPFDRWVKGDDKAISSDAVRGFVLFNGKANCAVCHMGWRMSDDGFHDIGLADTDRGRAAIMPGIVQLERAFKTPTLRNINQRAPYMHDGSLPTLAAVIDHYDGAFEARPSLDANMHKLGLTKEEKAQLLAFLNTLTSADDPVALAMLPQ
jgi:cytochrome c peroxidase